MPSPPNKVQYRLPFRPVAPASPPAPPAAAAVDRPAMTRPRRIVADLSWFLLAFAGWSAINLLAVLGCVMLAFLVISHGDVAMFIHQVNNLTTRYVAADTVRQHGFDTLVFRLILLLTFLIFVSRLSGFIRHVRRELSHKDRP